MWWRFAAFNWCIFKSFELFLIWITSIESVDCVSNLNQCFCLNFAFSKIFLTMKTLWIWRSKVEWFDCHKKHHQDVMNQRSSIWQRLKDCDILRMNFGEKWNDHASWQEHNKKLRVLLHFYCPRISIYSRKYPHICIPSVPPDVSFSELQTLMSSMLLQ